MHFHIFSRFSSHLISYLNKYVVFCYNLNCYELLGLKADVQDMFWIILWQEPELWERIQFWFLLGQNDIVLAVPAPVSDLQHCIMKYMVHLWSQVLLSLVILRLSYQYKKSKDRFNMALKAEYKIVWQYRYNILIKNVPQMKKQDRIS